MRDAQWPASEPPGALCRPTTQHPPSSARLSGCKWRNHPRANRIAPKCLPTERRLFPSAAQSADPAMNVRAASIVTPAAAARPAVCVFACAASLSSELRPIAADNLNLKVRHCKRVQSAELSACQLGAAPSAGRPTGWPLSQAAPSRAAELTRESQILKASGGGGARAATATVAASPRIWNGNSGERLGAPLAHLCVAPTHNKCLSSEAAERERQRPADCRLRTGIALWW